MKGDADMAKLRLVQFWTEAIENEDNQRLESEILRLRERVCERAAREAKIQDRRTRIRNAGIWFLSIATAVLYLWSLGR